MTHSNDAIAQKLAERVKRLEEILRSFEMASLTADTEPVIDSIKTLIVQMVTEDANKNQRLVQLAITNAAGTFQSTGTTPFRQLSLRRFDEISVYSKQLDEELAKVIYFSVDSEVRSCCLQDLADDGKSLGSLFVEAILRHGRENGTLVTF